MVNSILVTVLRNANQAFQSAITVNPMSISGADAKGIHSWVVMFRNANQVFLAPLLVMDLKRPHLVIALRNANKHFWRRCREGHRLKKKI
jgi:hypothetical protein